MKVSLSWLKQYVDIEVSPVELCDRMIMQGFEVESMEDQSDSMRNVVVGRIEGLEKHPDADKLLICMMNVGNENIQIVTGASNVFVGALVPVALDDSLLPNGKTIKKGKLRGVLSQGMLCSGEELCLTEEEYPGAGVYGILILQGDPAPGTDMRQVLGKNDCIIDFKITANRPDCLSVLGIAKEVAVALDKPFRLPETVFEEKGGSIADFMDVQVLDFDLCPRYIGRVVKNIRMAPSPAWLQERLLAAGMRPISNIVDITNYVMLETGQPMHAFDLRDLQGSQIIVRRAAQEEEIITLDSKPHTLQSDMLVIADGTRPVALAGIMGGENSEIKEDTSAILFESAKFRRDSVRKTARALGIRTESSARFEKGIDIYNTEYAMNRALFLIEELDAGDIVAGVIDRREALPPVRILQVKISRINGLLGIEVPAEEMLRILSRLGIETIEKDGVLYCAIPSWREDIEGEADIAEEIIRIYGYDKITGTPMTGPVLRGKKLEAHQYRDIVKQWLVACAMREITTYSFISEKAYGALHLPEDDARRNAVKLLNPLGEDYSVLRTQLYSSMLTVLGTNFSRSLPAARLFEVNKIYLPKSMPVTEQPLEQPALCIGCYSAGEDFYKLKGYVEGLLARFGVSADFAPGAEPFLHPGRQAAATVKGKTIAVLGQVHPDIAQGYGIEAEVYIAQLNLELLYSLAQMKVLYKPLPKYPASERDLAVVVDAAQLIGPMLSAISSAGGELLREVKLFDIYKGAQVGEGKMSVAFSLVLRADDRTLTDEETGKVFDKLVRTLEYKFGAKLR